VEAKNKAKNKYLLLILATQPILLDTLSNPSSELHQSDIL